MSLLQGFFVGHICLLLLAPLSLELQFFFFSGQGFLDLFFSLVNWEKAQDINQWEDERGKVTKVRPLASPFIHLCGP